MQHIVVLLFWLVPSAGLLGSWTAARPRLSQRLLGSWTAARPRLSQRVRRSCSSTGPQTPATAGNNDESRAALVRELLELFQGNLTTMIRVSRIDTPWYILVQKIVDQAGRDYRWYRSSRSTQLPRPFLRWLLKEFPVTQTVVADHEAGMMPGPGGGHEHIHCSLTLLDPALVPEQLAAPPPGGRRSSSGEEGREGPEGLDRPLAVVAAKYYFNGDSDVVFRYRLYSFHACPHSAGASHIPGPLIHCVHHSAAEYAGLERDVVMRLWRLLPHVEARLRAQSYDLTFDWSSGDDDSRQRPRRPEHGLGSETSSNQCCQANSTGGRDDVVERMFGCEIYWRRHEEGAEGGDADRGQGAGIDGATAKPAVTARSETTPATAGWVAGSGGKSFVGLMGEDDSGTWVESQNVDGLEILVKDDLRLWADQLWVNDRGFDRQGNFVYGNQRNVPYKMRRVVAAGPLGGRWGQHRTKEAYAEKMAAIGVIPGQRLGPLLRRATPAGAGS